MDDLLVTRTVCARVPTLNGEYKLCLYKSNRDDKENLAFIMGEIEGKSGVLARVHSECFTGDVLGSLRCDCGEQLQRALQLVALEGEGVVLYLRQEGRGIGLADKLRAYNLQDLGYDTVDANIMLGHQADERDYTIAVRILEDLGVQSVRLMTNNPNKIVELEEAGVKVVERVALEPTLITPDNVDYLFTKLRRMNHLLSLEPIPIEHLAGQHGTD